MTSKQEVCFYIPGIYENFELNRLFIDYMTSHTEQFCDCKICSVYGSFPGMIWDGGRLINPARLPYDEWKGIIAEYNNRGVAVRYACTNSAMEEHYLSDYYCNDIIAYSETGTNEIIVNSEVLEEYLRNKYPRYRYISSTTKCLSTEKELEEELQKDYYLVVPDFALNHTEALFRVEHPEKCEILLNDSCGRHCPNRKLDYYAVSRRNIGLNLRRK